MIAYLIHSGALRAADYTLHPSLYPTNLRQLCCFQVHTCRCGANAVHDGPGHLEIQVSLILICTVSRALADEEVRLLFVVALCRDDGDCDAVPE